MQELKDDESARVAFVQNIINQHKESIAYQFAKDAEQYYNGNNVTIRKAEKYITDLNGQQHKDIWSANHKISSRFFGFDVDQSVNYLLGNGISFNKKNTLDNLGDRFWEKTCDLLTYAQIGGVSFGFWDNGIMYPFSILEFAPLYDEENGALGAGVRFWQIADNKPLRCTLYEIDGYTEYIKRKGENMEIKQEKRPYIIHVTKNEMDTDTIYSGENYNGFPIVPLKNNKDCLSEIFGKRNTIDALDLCTSGLVNNVDECNFVYWAIQNAPGMDKVDADNFLRSVKMTHMAFIDNATDGATAEPHPIEAPYEGHQAAIDVLTKRCYEDFQAFDSSAVTAGNQTATAIKASYVPLDLKVDRLERNVTEFINGILKLAGIDDEPTYSRNQIINKTEEIQTLLMAAPYMDDEYITTKALTILGDANMVDDVLKRRAAYDLGRFDGKGAEQERENG